MCRPSRRGSAGPAVHVHLRGGVRRRTGLADHAGSGRTVPIRPVPAFLRRPPARGVAVGGSSEAKKTGPHGSHGPAPRSWDGYRRGSKRRPINSPPRGLIRDRQDRTRLQRDEPQHRVRPGARLNYAAQINDCRRVPHSIAEMPTARLYLCSTGIYCCTLPTKNLWIVEPGCGA